MAVMRRGRGTGAHPVNRNGHGYGHFTPTQYTPTLLDLLMVVLERSQETILVTMRVLEHSQETIPELSRVLEHSLQHMREHMPGRATMRQTTPETLLVLEHTPQTTPVHMPVRATMQKLIRLDMPVQETMVTHTLEHMQATETLQAIMSPGSLVVEPIAAVIRQETLLDLVTLRQTILVPMPDRVTIRKHIRSTTQVQETMLSHMLVHMQAIETMWVVIRQETLPVHATMRQTIPVIMLVRETLPETIHLHLMQVREIIVQTILGSTPVHATMRQTIVRHTLVRETLPETIHRTSQVQEPRMKTLCLQQVTSQETLPERELTPQHMQVHATTVAQRIPETMRVLEVTLQTLLVPERIRVPMPEHILVTQLLLRKTPLIPSIYG